MKEYQSIGREVRVTTVGWCNADPDYRERRAYVMEIARYPRGQFFKLFTADWHVATVKSDGTGTIPWRFV